MMELSREQAIYLREKYGSPLYLYDAQGIEGQYRKLADNFPAKIFYAVKANSNLSILSLLKGVGAGFDVVSEGELRRALAIGANPELIVFSGVGKTRAELEFAVEAQIRSINVESIDELELLVGICQEKNRTVNIALRLNPDVAAQTHSYLSTGTADTKFGFCEGGFTEALELLKKVPAVTLDGLSCHIGSNVASVFALREAYFFMVQAIERIRALGFAPSFLDLGGGFAVGYSGAQTPVDVSAIGGVIAEVAKATGLQLLVEPGKFLVAEQGVLLTSLLYRKQQDAKVFYVVDAGMNDLMRPALYDAVHVIDSLALIGETEIADIVGPVCESGCFLGRNRMVKISQPGEIFVIRDVGAYGASMGSHYNSRRKPPEILLFADGSERIIRRAEEWESLWEAEPLPNP